MRPTDAAGTVRQITLYAAKGETESFQIIVQAPSTGALTNVSVTAPNLGGPTSTLYREHYLYLARGSADWSSNLNKPEGAGYWPDGLVPFLNPSTGAPLTGGTIGSAPFTVAAGQNQPVWVDVFVPRTATAGTYTGTYTVTSAQGNATVGLTLNVWRFALPLQPALRSSFLYWETKDGGEGRGVLQADQELLRNRLNPISTTPSYERSLIDNYGLASSTLSFWSNAYHTTTMPPPPTVAEILADKAKHQPDMYLYCYSADEVSDPAIYPDLKAWARNLHAAGIDQFVTTPPVPDLYDDGSGTGRSAVDDWVLLPRTYVKYQNNVLTVQAKGDKVWSYNATQQDDYSPKWLLDYAPINYRIQPGFISASLGLVGLFYWRIDWWSTDSWNGVQKWPSFPGEGLLLYPGAPVGLPGQALASMRLKYLRDGADDYDYVQLLKAQGEGAWAVGVAATVGPDWSHWTRDPNALEAARLQLGNRLDGLAAGETVTVNVYASPTTIVSAGSTTLTATATTSTGAAITAWAWSDLGAGGIFSPSSTVQDPTYTAAANSTGSTRVITLMVTATAGTLSGSKSLSIIEQSTTGSGHSLTANAYAVPDTVEAGGSTSVSATATDSQGHTGFLYAWSDNGAGGSFSPSAAVASPTYTAPGNASSTAVTRTLTATVICVWVAPYISASANVAVTEGPSTHTVAAMASASPTTLASGDSTILSATATDSEGHTGFLYAWSDNGAGGTFSPSAGVASSTYTAPVNTAGSDLIVTLSVTATCASPDPASGSATVLLTVQPASGPAADFSGAPLRGKSSLAVDFSDLSVGAITSWAWDFGDGSTSTDQSPSHAYTKPGAYSVSLTITSAGGLNTRLQPHYVKVSFSDVDITPVDPSDWWALYQILACVGAGVVSGYEEPDGTNTYRPTSPVDRGQMAVYIARALAGGDASVPTGPSVATFTDVATDFWAFKYVEDAVVQGVVTGYEEPDGTNTYRPTSPVDRGQMAVYIARAMAGGESGVPSGPATASFPDVPTDFWAFRYVEYAVGQGVVAGYDEPDGTKTYRPDTPVTRDQMAVYVQRAFQLPM